MLAIKSNSKDPFIVAPADEKSVEKLYLKDFIDLEGEYFIFSRDGS